MKKTIQKLKKNVFTQFSLKIFEYICRKLALKTWQTNLFIFFFYSVTFLQFAKIVKIITIQAAIIKKM